jgi:putative nucleotidyltransferase with HDIG domain
MSWSPFDDFDQTGPVGVGLPAPEATPIVVVDDEQPVLDLLGKVLTREGYPTDTFESPTEALGRISEGGVALLITDLKMPVMSGTDLARRALEEDPDLAVLVLTGAADTDSAVESLRLGVEDYLKKPISIDALTEAVVRALRHRSQSLYRHKIEAWLRAEVDKRMEQVRRQAAQIEQVSLAALSALVRAMEAKDPYLKGHSEKVAGLCESMAAKLGFDPGELADVRTAGLLHDIGMIAIRESVTQKQGELTAEEYEHVREHVDIGAAILQPLPQVAEAVKYIQCHHERLDGSGYPGGVGKSEIPLGGQVVGLAEMYVSMTEQRAHRQARSNLEAIEALGEGRGVWFDPRVYDALEQALREEQQA